MADKADDRTEDLSGGQKQRLSIACALVHEPDVVFLDEPTAALDPQARRNLWDLLRSLNHSGRTVMLTTHYMDEAEALCDRVGIMDHGSILELDTPAALVRGLDAPVRITSWPTVSRAPSRRAAGPRAGRSAARDALDGLSVKGASLEDVFLADRTGVSRMTAFSSLASAMLKGFFRDKMAFFFAVIFPLMFLVLFGGIFNDSGAPKADIVQVGKVAVLDGAPAEAKDALFKTLTITKTSDEAAALRKVRKGDADAAVMQRGKNVKLRYSQADQVKAATVQGIFSSSSSPRTSPPPDSRRPWP